MKVEVWYAVDEDGGQYLFTSKPKRYVEGDSNYWINLNCPNEDKFAGNFNYTQISEEDRIQLNIPMISWKNEPIKIELDIQAIVINQSSNSHQSIRQYCTVLLINQLFL